MRVCTKQHNEFTNRQLVGKAPPILAAACLVGVALIAIQPAKLPYCCVQFEFIGQYSSLV